MTTWQPPIPSGALYSPHAIALGPGLALLAWCYDQVERDGSIQISLEKAAADIGKPYGTIRDWWKALRGSEGKSPFFSEITPCGRKGWRVVFRTRWLDWRIMRHNYPERRHFSDEDTFTAEMSADNQQPDVDRGLSAEISAVNADSAEKPAVSSQFERRDFSDEDPAYKVLMDDQESPPPPETKTQPPREDSGAAGAAGGGGEVANATSRWRNHPVYQLLAQPKYGILHADRLMPDWQHAPLEQVQKLLERLYKQHYSANAPNQLAGRMYLALRAGPGVLLKPPARAAPPPAPPPVTPRGDARAIAALFVEGRTNVKPSAD